MSDDDHLIYAEWDGLDPADQDALDRRAAAEPAVHRARMQARQLRADLRGLGPQGAEVVAPPIDFAALARATPPPSRRRGGGWIAAAAAVLAGAGGWWAISAIDEPTQAPIAVASAPAENLTSTPAKADEPIAVQFRIRAPEARAVTVAGDFNDWEPEALEMQRADSGLWSARTALPPGRYAYMYVVDGQWITPPDARRTQDDGFGARNGVLDLLDPSDA